MNTLSNTPVDTARQMEQRILQRLQVNGMQTVIAASSGMSESTISRLKNDHLGNFCQMLAFAGFKLVHQDEKTISEEKLQAFALLASDIFKCPDRVVDLLTGEGD